MDAFYKQKFVGILRQLQAGGLTVLMVSHDVEFCAAYADRCALFFDGGVVTEGTPRAFFSGNSFYTTAANRMSRGLLPGVVTTADLLAALAALPE
jgi:energy-coupling factor transport system ATP-binding protein